MEIQIEELNSASSILKKVKHNEEVMNAGFGKSTSLAGSSGSLNSDNVNSDVSYHDNDNDDDDDDAIDDGEDVSDYDDNDDYLFENDDDDDDDYLSMQAQFDNVDLPPGVEASVSWLKGPPPSTSVPAAISTSAPSDAASLSAEAGTSAGIVPDLASNNSKDLAGSEGKEEEAEKEAQLMQRFEYFKHFDIVEDFSDHHFINEGFRGQQPPKDWTKKVQDEWKILEKDLPDTIYVRVYEARMDLLRAVIVGPAGTPYHDGLFTFDVLFPPTYPDIPPMVYYHSGGLRLNPNLYDCGKVCLSLLGTWSGQGSEKWMPDKSTMLQVLVSIQALILNTNPFFNEPGYDRMYTGAEGDRRSKGYNEDVFILSLKTMMYTLRRPPKYFEDLVAGHFRTRARVILSACRAYMEGVQVGCIVNGSGQDDVKNGSREFKAAVGRMMNGLVSNFSRYGAVDCEEFRIAS